MTPMEEGRAFADILLTFLRMPEDEWRDHVKWTRRGSHDPKALFNVAVAERLRSKLSGRTPA